MTANESRPTKAAIEDLAGGLAIFLNSTVGPSETHGIAGGDAR